MTPSLLKSARRWDNRLNIEWLSVPPSQGER